MIELPIKMEIIRKFDLSYKKHSLYQQPTYDLTTIALTKYSDKNSISHGLKNKHIN